MFRNKGMLIANSFWEFVLCEQLAKIRVKLFVWRFKNSSNHEIKEIADFYKNNKTTPFQKIFPYPFVEKYKESDVKLLYDGEDYYVNRNGKNLYLGHNYARERDAVLTYQRLLIEQDEESPHRYFSDLFYPDTDTVFLDIGGAEGIASLDVIEKCKKVFIFECDSEWISVLHKTFADYKDKVVIVNKFVDDHTDDLHISIDDFVKEFNLQEEKLFLKIDAEGSEASIIEGAKNTLKNMDVSLAICTYHKTEDEARLRGIFKHWYIEHSKGYMFFIYDFKIKFPYLRRGVYRIKKI